MKKTKKLMAVMLSVILVMSVLYAPVSAEASESTEQPLVISSVVSNKVWYNSSDATANRQTASVEMSVARDGEYGTWVQWDAAASASPGVNLAIGLENMSRVSKIELYVGKATWSNTSRVNSKYTSVPVTANGIDAAEGWGVATSKVLNGTGALSAEVIAQTSMAAGNTADDLQKIVIDVDSLCDSLILNLTAAGGSLDAVSGEWTNADNTTRMAVAEIVVYGEAISDVLRDENGAVCTVESNKKAANGLIEENMLNDDSGYATSSIPRWRGGRPREGSVPTELIFRLDGVYNISGLRASEYWQSKYQTETTFKDVDLYIGNTTGATTEWTQIADGLTFNVATAAGHSHNFIYGAADDIYTGDSFKMVINGTDFSGEDEDYSQFNMLTNVSLYGEKTEAVLGGTTMRYCDISSTVGETSYPFVNNKADTVILTPTFSGTSPGTVIVAVYNAGGNLIGVNIGQPDAEIIMNIESGETISYVKILGWEDTNSLVPVSTPFMRFAITG